MDERIAENAGKAELMIQSNFAQDNRRSTATVSTIARATLLQNDSMASYAVSIWHAITIVPTLQNVEALLQTLRPLVQVHATSALPGGFPLLSKTWSIGQMGELAL